MKKFKYLVILFVLMELKGKKFFLIVFMFDLTFLL